MIHDITTGLWHIHKKNVLHRDLKSENILVCFGVFVDFRLSMRIVLVGYSM